MTKSKGIVATREAQKWLDSLSADRARLDKMDIFDIAEEYVYEWWYVQRFSDYTDVVDPLQTDREYIVVMNRMEELRKRQAFLENHYLEGLYP